MNEWRFNSGFKARLRGGSPGWATQPEDFPALVRSMMFDPASGIMAALNVTESNDAVTAALESQIALLLAITEESDTLSATVFAAVINAVLAATEAGDTLAAAIDAQTSLVLAKIEEGDTLLAEAISASGFVLDVQEAGDVIAAAFQYIFSPAPIDQTSRVPFELRASIRPPEDRASTVPAARSTVRPPEIRKVIA